MYGLRLVRSGWKFLLENVPLKIIQTLTQRQGKLMLNVTIDEIQRDPLKYLNQVEAGETLVIVRSDKAIAELRPIARKPLRPFGLCAGEFTVPNDFDAPLPEDLLNAFEGK
jgi:antitoxin (DNA-binding transcriptional repressor) of toxin-antitoxin stability system